MDHMDSSISSGTAVCLALVVGCAILAGATGVALATASVDGSLEESTEDSSTDNAAETVDDSTDEMADDDDGTADDETVDEDESTVNEDDTVDEPTDTTDSVDDTTDSVDNTTDDLNETTETVRNATDETTDGLEETVDETADEIDDVANETAGEADSLLEDPVDSATETLAETGAGVEDGISATVSAAASIQIPGTDASVATIVDGEPALGAIFGGEPAAPGPAQSATDAMLVGLMGTMTASAGAAGGAGTAGGGLTGAASNAVANWSATGRRSLRRALAAIPWELVPILKYSRYDDSDPLENETRSAIYETVEADPGRYLSQISDEIDVPLSTVRHHVRILEDEDLLTTAKINGKRRYYLEETDSELRAALEEPAKRDVLEALATLERANNSELAAELDRDPSTITHHLATLEDDGLVVREREGRSVVNELTAEASAALFENENTTLEDPSPQAPAD